MYNVHCIHFYCRTIGNLRMNNPLDTNFTHNTIVSLYTDFTHSSMVSLHFQDR